MLYKFDIDRVKMNTRVKLTSNNSISLTMGKSIDESSLSLPFTGEMIKDQGGRPLYYSFYPASCAMSTDLIDALIDGGIQNLQTFKLELEGKAKIPLGYKVVNIVGLLTCANMDKSKSTRLADLVYFHELVMKRTDNNGLHMFRLAESEIDIIVDDLVAEIVRKNKFPGIVLDPLQ